MTKPKTGDTKMKERRTGKRSDIELAASFGMGDDPRPERNMKINNISPRGFCFLCDHDLRVGEDVEVSVDLDTQEQVILNVKVVWVKPQKKNQYQVGVQFVDDEGPDFERFMEFYKQHS